MRPPHFHVLCGGGTGALVLRKLQELGYRLSAGPVSDLDDDARTGRALGVELVLTADGGVPQPDAADRARALLSDADAVILTPFAVGRGNLESLVLATELPAEKPLYLVGGGAFALRDHTGGTAARLFERLQGRAVALPRSAHELVPLLVSRFPPT